jgi:2-oxo-4-hydroxy-4-carboxy-5-ureidoimidazoline decarboxylase
VYAAADAIWLKLDRADWLEAFTHHPKIGDMDSLRAKFATTKEWAAGEQSGVNAANEEVLRGLADGNREYEQRFGHIFIVCATGKSAQEMLTLLRARLHNEADKELRIAAGEQAKITRIRLEKLLN